MDEKTWSTGNMGDVTFLFPADTTVLLSLMWDNTAMDNRNGSKHISRIRILSLGNPGVGKVELHVYNNYTVWYISAFQQYTHYSYRYIYFFPVLIFVYSFIISQLTFVLQSCLIKRYCEKRFVNKYVPTVGIDYGSTAVEVDGRKVSVHFFDTSGSPLFEEVRVLAGVWWW